MKWVTSFHDAEAAPPPSREMSDAERLILVALRRKNGVLSVQKACRSFCRSFCRRSMTSSDDAPSAPFLSNWTLKDVLRLFKTWRTSSSEEVLIFECQLKTSNVLEHLRLSCAKIERPLRTEAGAAALESWCQVPRTRTSRTPGAASFPSLLMVTNYIFFLQCVYMKLS